MRPAELRLGLKQRDKVVLDHTWRDLVQGVLTELFKEPLSEAFIELRGDGCFVFAGIIQIDFLEKPCKVLQVGIFEDRPRPNLSFQVIFFLPCLSFGSDQRVSVFPVERELIEFSIHPELGLACILYYGADSPEHSGSGSRVG